MSNGIDIKPYLIEGLNLGMKAATSMIPGGDLAFEAGIDGFELACKMGLAIAPKIRDKTITAEEFDAIREEFGKNVPGATMEVALKILKSGMDRTISGIFK